MCDTQGTFCSCIAYLDFSFFSAQGPCIFFFCPMCSINAYYVFVKWHFSIKSQCVVIGSKSKKCQFWSQIISMRNILMKTQGFIYHSFISIIFLRVFLVIYCLLRKHTVWHVIWREHQRFWRVHLGKNSASSLWTSSVIFICLLFQHTVFSHIFCWNKNLLGKIPW